MKSQPSGMSIYQVIANFGWYVATSSHVLTTTYKKEPREIQILCLYQVIESNKLIVIKIIISQSIILEVGVVMEEYKSHIVHLPLIIDVFDLV